MKLTVINKDVTTCKDWNHNNKIKTLWWTIKTLATFRDSHGLRENNLPAQFELRTCSRAFILHSIRPPFKMAAAPSLCPFSTFSTSLSFDVRKFATKSSCKLICLKSVYMTLVKMFVKAMVKEIKWIDTFKLYCDLTVKNGMNRFSV